MLSPALVASSLRVLAKLADAELCASALSPCAPLLFAAMEAHGRDRDVQNAGLLVMTALTKCVPVQLCVRKHADVCVDYSARICVCILVEVDVLLLLCSLLDTPNVVVLMSSMVLSSFYFVVLT